MAKAHKQSYGTRRQEPKTSIRGIDPKVLEQLSRMENMDSIVTLERDASQNVLGSIVSRLVATISSGSPYYIFLISQKPLNAVNEQYFAIDDEIVEKGVLGEPLEFNKIFFYKYKGEGDDSGPKKVLGVENIQSVNAIIYKGYYYLKINLENGKLYFLLFKHAIPVVYWLDGLRRAVKIQEEFSRSRFGVLRYNIEMLYKYHEKNSWVEINEVIGAVTAALDPALPIEAFLDKLDAAVREVNFFCDAFFAHKPFVQSLFEALIRTVHVSARTALMDFWNQNYLAMAAGDILGFGRALLDYKAVLKRWGVVDGKMDECLAPVVVTFVNRLFENSKEILFSVIDEAMFQFRVDANKLRNDSLRILEAHINLCFDNYAQMPVVEMAAQLVQMSLMLVTIVQINLIAQLQSPQKTLDADVLGSLLNNDFDQMVRRFMKKVHKKTNNKLSLKQIRDMANLEYFQRNSAKISAECLASLNAQIALETENMFLAQRTRFHRFDLQALIDALDARLGRVFLGLDKEHETFDLLDKLSLLVVQLYFAEFVRWAPKMKQRHVERLLAKIPEDRQRLLNYFRPFVGHEVDCNVDILRDLAEYLRTDDFEKTRIGLLKFVAFFGEQYGHPDQVRQIVSAKLFFSDKQVEMLLRDFLETRAQYLEARRKNRPTRIYVKRINPKVRQFVQVLKRRLRHRHQQARSTALNFRPQNTELALYTFSVDEVFAYFSDCRLVMFALDVDDFAIEEHLDAHIAGGEK